MKKYNDFEITNSMELVYKHNSYQVYRIDNQSILFVLVKNGQRLCSKSFQTDNIVNFNYVKWIKQWETSAADQIGKLEDQICVLKKEQKEISDMLLL